MTQTLLAVACAFCLSACTPADAPDGPAAHAQKKGKTSCTAANETGASCSASCASWEIAYCTDAHEDAAPRCVCVDPRPRQQR
jgi:hypothetical protein